MYVFLCVHAKLFIPTAIISFSLCSLFLSIYVFSCLALILLVGSPMHLTAAQTIELPIYCTALHMLNAIEIKMG